MVRNVVIFGATGSIGTSAINVIRRNKDKFNIVGITGNSNIEWLADIAHEFNVKNVGVFDEKFLKGRAQFFLPGTQFFHGEEGFSELATLENADSILMAIVGTSGLLPTVTAIESKKTILLASKEVLVVAGRYICESAKKNGVKILPIDSEHNAIFQCLQGGKKEDVDRLILTASGGPFRNFSEFELENVTPEQALRHPTWNMGYKISIDSATMANKGLEVIEARWLFDMPASRIDILIHPESIIHSMVEFCDGSIIAQMCPTNMEFPISNCLFFPERAHFVGRKLDFISIKSLTFEAVDLKKFPILSLVRQCLNREDNSCAVFQAANEVAVENFLSGRIKFTEIYAVIAETLSQYLGEREASLAASIVTVDHARAIAWSVVQRLKN